LDAGQALAQDPTDLFALYKQFHNKYRIFHCDSAYQYAAIADIGSSTKETFAIFNLADL
jgi:hypothetical protein